MTLWPSRFAWENASEKQALSAITERANPDRDLEWLGWDGWVSPVLDASDSVDTDG